MPARESPSQWFFASPDQIDTLGMPRSWIHGQVIATLGDTFCYPSCLGPRHGQYKILPMDLFDLWNSYMGGHTTSQASLSFHFKQAASLFKCCVWCDVCSPKASLSQGREVEREGIGTPELTDTDLLTCGSGGKWD
jgi:hypothetical protein